MYVVCTSNEYTQHTIIVEKIKKTSLNYHHLLSDLASWYLVQWLELSMSRMNFHGPNGVRAIVVCLYIFFFNEEIIFCGYLVEAPHRRKYVVGTH